MAINLNRLIREGIRNPAQAIQFLFSLPKIIKLIYRLFKDARVPLHLKTVLVLALIYVISPIDLIPDLLIPVVGYMDDLFILIAASNYFLKKCPPQIVESHIRNIQQGN